MQKKAKLDLQSSRVQFSLKLNRDQNDDPEENRGRLACHFQLSKYACRRDQAGGVAKFAKNFPIEYGLRISEVFFDVIVAKAR